MLASLLVLPCNNSQTMNNTRFYDYSAKDISGNEIKMSQYKGKVVLVVNTASKCGLTPQLEGLEALYKKYKDKGFEIIGFPCNQFLKQEPLEGKAIEEFCLVNYGVSFKIFDKIKVNGKDTHPLYKFLKDALPGTLGNAIKWNFTKFLIGADGTPIKRFSPQDKPQSIEVFFESEKSSVF